MPTSIPKENGSVSDRNPLPDIPRFASSILTVIDGTAEAVVTITDKSDLTKLSVKTTPSRATGLGPAFGTSELVGEALVCGSRPGEWLVIGEADAVRAAVGDVEAHTVDLTHGRVLIEVAGEAAAGTLEKICNLDWSDSMTPDGAVVSASVAKISCDVIRHDNDGRRAYLVAADRSFGQYLYDAIADAAAEFSH